MTFNRVRHEKFKTAELILRRAGSVYVLGSGVRTLAMRGLMKMSKDEMDALLLMISTSIMQEKGVK